MSFPQPAQAPGPGCSQLGVREPAFLHSTACVLLRTPHALCEQNKVNKSEQSQKSILACSPAPRTLCGTTTTFPSEQQINTFIALLCHPSPSQECRRTCRQTDRSPGCPYVREANSRLQLLAGKEIFMSFFISIYMSKKSIFDATFVLFQNNRRNLLLYL